MKNNSFIRHQKLYMPQQQLEHKIISIAAALCLMVGFITGVAVTLWNVNHINSQVRSAVTNDCDISVDQDSLQADLKEGQQI